MMVQAVEDLNFVTNLWLQLGHPLPLQVFGEVQHQKGVLCCIHYLSLPLK